MSAKRLNGISSDDILDEWLPKTRRPALDHPNPDHERRWKDDIILRDGTTCRACNRHSCYSGQMECHHVTYERFGNELPEDGILVCKPCHDVITAEQRKRIGCKKIKHETAKAARLHLMELSKGGTIPFGSFYHCKVCHGFHVTSNPADNNNKFRRL